VATSRSSTAYETRRRKVGRKLNYVIALFSVPVVCFVASLGAIAAVVEAVTDKEGVDDES
jgi:hypothetical protein